MSSNLRYISKEDFIKAVPDEIRILISNDLQDGQDEYQYVVLDKALAAEGVFESYVSNAYPLPVLASDGSVPHIVQHSILSLFKYFLYERRNAVSEQIQKQYDNTIKWLVSVSSGKAFIPLVDSVGTVESTGVPVIIEIGGDHSQFRTIV